MRSKYFYLVLFLFYGPISAQVKQDLGQVHRQLYYKPGDWITVSATRYATGIAVSFKTAYIGTIGGVLRYDILKKHFDYPLTFGNGMLDNDVRVVAYDGQTDFAWMATKTGLQFYNPQSQLFSAATYSQLGISMNENILSIGFSGSTAWIETNKFFYSTSNSILSLSRQKSPPETTLWFGQRALLKTRLPHIFTNQEAGFQFYDSESAFVDLDFRKFPVTYYTEDPYGNFWIATFGAGAWCARNVSYLAEPLFYGLAMDNVTGMAFDDAAMWLGGNSSNSLDNNFDMSNSGITEWNQETDEFKYYYSGMRLGIRAAHATALLADSQNIWIGTEDGLIRRSKKGNSWTTYGTYSGLYHAHVLSLASADQQTIFIGTEHGLNYATLVDKDYAIYKVEILELANIAIFKVRISEGIIWLGTNNGIYAIDRKTQKWLHYSALGYLMGQKTFLGQRVHGIAEDAASLYFVSEMSVTRFDKKNKAWESLPVMTDFLQPGINDAICDDRNLWIATNSGVLRYAKRTKKWIYYGVQDGLADGVVNVVLLDGDYVWFGTNKGVTQFFWNAPHLLDSE
jgi:hypothetical protein